MSSHQDNTAIQAWNDLATYRERYDIEDRLDAVRGLERSIDRRAVRLATAQRRLHELELMMIESRQELAVVEGEIDKSRKTGAFLIEEILHQVRIDYDERWTPAPIKGFRMWQITETGLQGVKTRWTSPVMDARCLQRVPGQDVPHSLGQCGPPACGIYTTKRLDLFPRSATGHLDRGQALGVVAMTGKVVEHTDGYRGAHATVVAIAARLNGRWLATDDSRLVHDLFTDPHTTITRAGHPEPFDDQTINQLLERAMKKEQTWTSDPN